MSTLRERLIQAHIEHELVTWRGAGRTRTIEDWVHALFEWFGEVTLDEVATRDQIMGIIERYVIELRVSGGITELTGEMSQLVFASPASADTRLEQILTPASYREFADKLFALDTVRRELLGLIAKSSAMTSINARMLAHELLSLLSAPVPSVSSRVRGLAGRLGLQLPELADALGHWLERYTRGAQRHLLEVLDAESLRATVDELWDNVSTMRLSEAFDLIGEQDIEDFVVLIYEFWLRYRKTEFFRRITTELVEYFFQKYGQESLLSLIEDMGVTEEMVSSELAEVLGPLVDRAAATGFLEQLLRARLESFYNSPAAEAVLRERDRDG
jgi:hypothetical protein